MDEQADSPKPKKSDIGDPDAQKMDGSRTETGGGDESVKMGTDRSFGLVFAVAFLLLAAYMAWASNNTWPFWGGIGLIFGTVALLFPSTLRPLNKLWFRFGLLLHKILSPVILGLMFFLTITPIAMVLKLVGKDVLKLRFEPECRTYWIERQPPGPESSSMKDQF